MPTGIAEIAACVRRWAIAEPEVGAAWLYGSRVLGKQRPDSDLDIAVRSSRLLRQEEVDAFQANFPRWEKALSEELGLPVHIQPKDADLVRQAVELYGVLLYSSLADPPDPR